MDRERVVLLELFGRYERLSKRHDFENLNQHENVVVPFFSTSQQSDDVLSSLPRMDGKAFLKNRQDLQEKILKIFDKKLFREQRFPVKLEWSKTLNKTAGVTLCKQKGSNREATIQLASKVITSTDRLISTLAHEMCHAAAFMIDGTCKPPHGPCFYKWGRMFEQCFPGVKVSTCHNYEIEYKFKWKCCGCGQIVGRHSKSFDPAKFTCGKCQKNFVRIK